MIISGSVISQSSEYITGNSLFRNGSNQVSNINYRVYLNSQMTSLTSGCSGYAGTIYNGNPSIWNMPTNTIIVEPQWSEAWTDYKSGVSSIDATIIQSWVNNGAPTPYGMKEVAADVDQSNIIAYPDAVAIQSLILGNSSKFISNMGGTTPSWYIFHNQSMPSNPGMFDAINGPGISFPTKSFSNIYGNTIWQFNHIYFDYRLTKVGDVSSSSQGGGNAWVCGSYSINSESTENRNYSEVKKGSLIDVAITFESQDEIIALQLPIDYDNTKFELVAVNFGSDFYSPWNYNPFSRELTFMTFNEDLSTLSVGNGKEFISFQLKALEDISNLNTAIKWSDKTEIEMVNKDIELSKGQLLLNIKSIAPPISEFAINGNISDLTASMNMEKEGKYQLSFFNTFGQLAYKKVFYLSQGSNIINIDDFHGHGLFIGTLRGNKEVLSTKFIITN